MAQSEFVKLGIIGVGGMGGTHAKAILNKKIKKCRLTAVADCSESVLSEYGDAVAKYNDGEKLIVSGKVDAVLIATPHFSHTSLGIAALKQGLHVLVEKPISVHKADCEKLIGAHKKRNQVFAAMFNQRTDPHYKKVKELIDNGDLGKLIRINWVITNWFRTEYYYAKGGWRATWEGEGGGVLINQCPHQLDLLQWFCGMPVKVRGFCGLGKRHNIEVEDEVTAYLEYKNGATGVFITSTGEAPGSSRLEICGEMGKVVVEDGKVMFTRNKESSIKFGKKSKESFATPETEQIKISAKGAGGQHLEVIQNFIDAIVDGVPLIAPAKEGVKSVELGNAMLYSSLMNKQIDLPLDGKAYQRKLNQLIKNSTFVKKTVKAVGKEDLGSSFNTQ